MNAPASCLFCKIIAGDIPSTRVFESEQLVAFRDIHPKAPVHILVVPKRHFATVNELPATGELMNHLLAAVQQIVRDEKIAASGYRLIFNVNADGGQEVDHVHWHILGGKPLGRMVAP